jgi:mRNA-degrading endonuclease RelE of RelBE toxin-antitoxin system
MQKPQYRLRVDDVRVFYDVADDPETRIEILAIVPKKEAAEWLAREGLKS